MKRIRDRLILCKEDFNKHGHACFSIPCLNPNCRNQETHKTTCVGVMIPKQLSDYYGSPIILYDCCGLPCLWARCYECRFQIMVGLITDDKNNIVAVDFIKRSRKWNKHKHIWKKENENI